MDNYEGLKKVVEFYATPETEGENPVWTVLDRKMIASSISGVDEIVIGALVDILQKEMNDLDDNTGGFHIFFNAANNVCKKIETYPLKGDPEALCMAAAIIALSMASSYSGYISGHGDAMVAMEPKNRKERRHGIQTP